MSTNKPRQIEVENILHPGSIARVQADKYEAMRDALMDILPAIPPGLTVEQILVQVVAHLPEGLFPGGMKAGWWVKAVQLDLEAKGVIKREGTRPVRLYRT